MSRFAYVRREGRRCILESPLSFVRVEVGRLARHFDVSGPVETVLSEEVRSLHWVSLDKALAPEAQSTMEYVYQGTTLEFPCLRLDGLVIWGLTYRMFTNFQRLLEATAERTGATHEPPRARP